MTWLEELPVTWLPRADCSTHPQSISGSMSSVTDRCPGAALSDGYARWSRPAD